MIAGLAMALSSVCLVLNANRLHGANINVGAADGPAGSGQQHGGCRISRIGESANAANITGSATSNASHEPTVIIDDRTTLNQTNTYLTNPIIQPTRRTLWIRECTCTHRPRGRRNHHRPECGMTVGCERRCNRPRV